MSEYYFKSVSKYLANSRIYNLLGLIVGRLIVLQLVGPSRWGNMLWLCACSCGNTAIVPGGSLTQTRNGMPRTQSCGCLRVEMGEVRNLKHGEKRGGQVSPEYIAYNGAKARCHIGNARIDSRRYADRGIKFLFTSFEQFLAEVGRKPTPEHSLDRYPNKDGNYEPGNVRWATTIEQTRNKSNTLLITARGKTQSTSEWAIETGINQNRLWSRKRQLGWCDKCAVTPNLRRCEHRVKPT